MKEGLRDRAGDLQWCDSMNRDQGGREGMEEQRSPQILRRDGVLESEGLQRTMGAPNPLDAGEV